MIPYNPADAIQCWTKGVYQATLAAVVEGTSKKGAPMLTLSLQVYRSDGREQTVREYITFPNGTARLKRLAEALGEKQAFVSGTFDPASCIQRNLTVELEVEEQDGYPDKNRVAKYLPATIHSTAPAPAAPSPKTSAGERQAAQAGGDPLSDTPQFKEDDIPFDLGR
jgi:hypothetical protein